MDCQVTVSRVNLSDGSHVYNVIVPVSCLSAVTEHDALDLAEKIRNAIAEHTLHFTPRVAYDY